MRSAEKRDPALGMSHNGIYDRPGPKDLVTKTSDQMRSSSVSPATICLEPGKHSPPFFLFSWVVDGVRFPASRSWTDT
jgi:hypothetical protein